MQVHPLNRQKRRSRSDHASATFGYIEILDFEDGSCGSTIWWRSNGASISPFANTSAQHIRHGIIDGVDRCEIPYKVAFPSTSEYFVCIAGASRNKSLISKD